MKLVRCGSPRSFLDAAESFLLRDEAAHNLLLGVPASLVSQPAAAASGIYFAVVLDGTAVLAAALQTPPYNLVVSRTDSEPALSLIARDLHASGRLVPGVHAIVPLGLQFAEAWCALTGQRAEEIRAEGIYQLSTVRVPETVPGRLRPAAASERTLLIDWMQAFHHEAFRLHPPPFDAVRMVDRRLAASDEGMYVWDDGGPRAVAGFGGQTRDGIRIGPVYTPPEHRRRGYASACVAGVSQRMLDRGRRFCCLYADFTNPTASRIYQAIGYRLACEVREYRFLPAS